MKDHWHRVVLAALAAVAVSSGAVSIFLSATDSNAAVGQDHVIEILHTGFNPENCWIDRSDLFRFINKTNQPQRVLSQQNQHLDSGVIEPGETSKGFSFHFIGTMNFYLESNPAFVGKVTTDHARQCEPLPPTPTPTNTPTPSPTPIPTPEGRKGFVPLIGRE